MLKNPLHVCFRGTLFPVLLTIKITRSSLHVGKTEYLGHEFSCGVVKGIILLDWIGPCNQKLVL